MEAAGINLVYVMIVFGLPIYCLSVPCFTFAEEINLVKLISRTISHLFR